MTQCVFITGASSGLGEAMALEFANRGYALALTARRTDALENLKARILAEHPDLAVEIAYLDVCDTGSISACIEELSGRLGGLDILIANAGISGHFRIGSGRVEDDLKTLETNVLGCIATLDAAISYLMARDGGQVVAISSVAAYRGMPRFGAYSASKAAVATYMAAARAELRGSSIVTTTLFPGYIDTPINQSLAKRPFVISAEKGGRLLVNKILEQTGTSTVPVFPWNLVSRLMRWAPDAWISKL